MSLALFVILIVIVLCVAPVWGHSANWGYGPSGLLGVLALVLLILFLTGRL